jgi:N-acetylglucosaminyldiphosphoundecaprenol N-acetyl-beta-D-mannosaminyltransferase
VIASYRVGRLQLMSLEPRELLLYRDRLPLHVVTVNAEIFVMAHEDPEYLALLNQTFNTVDSRPLQWLAALLNGGSLPTKISGSDLIYDLAQHCRDIDASLFLLGSSPEANKQACERLCRRYPGLRVSGYAPRVTDDVFDGTWNAGIHERLQSGRSDYLVVCFGPPKQEWWIAQNRARLGKLGVRLAVGLGGAVDFVAGVQLRAPSVLQWLGLEWFFRVLTAPRKRFWRTLRFFRMPYHALRWRGRS